MTKIIILGYLCLVILYINHVNAQNRAGRPYKTPSTRILNKVEPKGRTRQQQMQIKHRQMSKTPPTHRKIKPAQARAYQDEWCINEPEGVFVHNDCDKYYYCEEDGFLNEYSCPEETPIFDYEYLTCMSEEEGGMCWQWVDDGNWESECPSDPNQIAFLPGETCEDYFICISGSPSQLFCGPGQHWNQIMEYCDTPANAQCDPTITPSPPSLPDCQNTAGTVPHPFNCRQFIYCEKNGSRIVQNCPHLMAYDVDLNKCVIEHLAKCGTSYSSY